MSRSLVQLNLVLGHASLQDTSGALHCLPQILYPYLKAFFLCF